MSENIALPEAIAKLCKISKRSTETFNKELQDDVY